jgi:hypothetical protein
MAASWGDAYREAMFKQVNGDFVFRAPGLVPRHYLVSMTQKAEIQRLSRARPGLNRRATRAGVKAGVGPAGGLAGDCLPV